MTGSSPTPRAPVSRYAISPPSVNLSALGREVPGARSLGDRSGVREVDDHVRHGDVELGACMLDHAGLEPVRALGWVRRDDDLVGGKRAQVIFDRDDRAVGADVAGRLEAGLVRPREALVEPPPRVA